MDDIYDIIVVGACVAGSAAATTFARQGRKVLLIERNLQASDRIVGELLQPGGVFALQELGSDESLKNIDAIGVRGYHIYWKGEKITFWYPPKQDRFQGPKGTKIKLKSPRGEASIMEGLCKSFATWRNVRIKSELLRSWLSHF
jgi:flavin-dependent dehydrogenase